MAAKKQAALTNLDDGVIQAIAVTAAQHRGELFLIEEVWVFFGNQGDWYQIGRVNDILRLHKKGLTGLM
jgi:hypothetical protein